MSLKEEVSKNSSLEKMKSKSSDILMNLGFTENFFEELSYHKLHSKLGSSSSFRKIGSESTVESISNLISKTQKDIESQELYQEDDMSNYFPVGVYDSVQIIKPSPIELNNCEISQIKSENTLSHEKKQKNDFDNAKLFSQMADYSNNTKKHVIKAYKSKHKSKFYQIYEWNSIKTEEMNKYRLFHKCNFPNCNRTFSSSGWLKAHFDEHYKEIQQHKFCVLFDKYINSTKSV